jgi:hypothetical protein
MRLNRPPLTFPEGRVLAAFKQQDPVRRRDAPKQSIP